MSILNEHVKRELSFIKMDIKELNSYVYNETQDEEQKQYMTLRFKQILNRIRELNKYID